LAAAPAQGDSRPATPVVKRDAPPADLLVVGPKIGAMEPCGCTGGQLGGLAKLKTQLDLVCQAQPGAVLVDCGGLTKGESPMERIRGEVMASIYQLLPNAVVALGPADLASGPDQTTMRAFLMQDPSLVARFPNARQVNIATGVELPKPIAASAVVEANGKGGVKSRVFVGSVSAADGAGADAAVKALRDEMGKNAGAFDLAVAVVHAPIAAARAVGTALPELDLILVGEGNGAPDERPQLHGNTLYLHPGQKGRHVVHLTLSRAGGTVRADGYSVDVIQTNIPADKDAEQRIASYRTQLDEKGIVKSLAGQRARPRSEYAGSAACQKCHISAYAVWEKSKHAHAVESMVARQGDKDPDCLKCHALGWYSEPPAGEKQGYMGNDPKGKLANVACESCHGAAKNHTVTPYSVKPRKDVTCQQCHDVENSPEFDRAKFWPKIFHENDK
jgi:nitrate/TMAO reductase-like tetraheme cytochrome c subunit